MDTLCALSLVNLQWEEPQLTLQERSLNCYISRLNVFKSAFYISHRECEGSVCEDGFFSHCLAPAKRVTVYGSWLTETWQRFKPLTYAQSYKDVIKGFKTLLWRRVGTSWPPKVTSNIYYSEILRQNTLWSLKPSKRTHTLRLYSSEFSGGQMLTEIGHYQFLWSQWKLQPLTPSVGFGLEILVRLLSWSQGLV